MVWSAIHPAAWDGAAFRESGRTLLDLVFPRPCAGCGIPAPPEGGHFCWDCRATFSYIQPPYCERCGDPVSGRIDHAYTCSLCARHKIHFDGARSAIRYQGVGGDAIRSLKYHGATWLAPDLAGLLDAVVQTHFMPDRLDVVVPVPLNLWRRWKRGYNQAGLLAVHLSRKIRKPFVYNALVRLKPTRTQTRLTARERAVNVHNVFRPGFQKCRVEGKRVLLVDDVMTTGATVNECARALKQCGASEVWVATVARG